MKEIQLSQNQVALVDDKDFAELSQNKWCCSQGYAVRNAPKGPGRKLALIHMHRVVNKTPEGMDTDHINGNKLDNRRCNLRDATRSQNIANQDGNSDRLYSSYKGVTYARNEKRPKRWVSQVHKKGEKPFYKRFYTEEGAALAYNVMAKRYHGEFARLNDIPDEEAEITNP